METLKDYFDSSLFNHAISNPMDYEGLLDKDKATKGIDTYTIDETMQVSKEQEGITVKGSKNQYWLGRNISIEDNLRDRYNYEVKVVPYDDFICVEVESDVERYVGSSYWDIVSLLTDQITTIPKENGVYHVSFEEFYSLKDGVLVHETNLSDKVEAYLVPEGFNLGDSFGDSEKYVFAHMELQEGIKKLKELKQERKDKQE